MIAKAALKYKLFEWALDTLFSKIQSNFSTFKFDIKVGQRFSKIVYGGAEYYDCVIVSYNPSVEGFLMFSCMYIIRSNSTIVAFLGKNVEEACRICDFPKFPEKIVNDDVYIFAIPTKMFRKYHDDISGIMFTQTGMFKGDSQTIKEFLFIE